MKKITHIFLFIVALIISSCFGEATKITTISITEYNPETEKKGVLIDVRTPKEFAEGHLPGAININVQNVDFSEKMNEISKKEKVYLYCKSGNRSTKATSILDTLGYKHIYNLDGGFLAWDEAGKPVEK